MLSKNLHKNTDRCSGCTLTGALSVTTGVTDAVTIVHGPAGCAHHNLSLFLSISKTAKNSRNPVILSTRLKETDIIFGGENALKETISHALIYKPSIIFILSTCIVGITGDDVEGTCAQLKGVKIVPIPGEGFLGGGFREGFISALTKLSDVQNSFQGKIKSGVNIIGERNLESSAEFQYIEVERLLNSLNLTVRTRFIRNIKAASIDLIPDASLNVLRDPSLVKIGEYLKQRYGTPYYSSFPEGFAETKRFISEIAGILDMDPTDALNYETLIQEAIKKEFFDLKGLRISRKNLHLELLTSNLMDELYADLNIQVTEEGIPFRFVDTPPVGSNGVRYILTKIRKSQIAGL